MIDLPLVELLQRQFQDNLDRLQGERAPDHGDRAWYDPSEAETADAWRGRIRFFEMVQAIAPEVVAFLSDRVLLVAEEEDMLAVARAAGRPAFLLSQHWPERARRELTAWAAKYNLTDSWAIEVAEMTVCGWLTHPGVDRTAFDLRWLRARHGEALELQWARAQEPGLALYVPGWNACVEASDYLDEVLSVIREGLTRYIEVGEQALKSRGWKRSVRKRARTADDALHFEWLVRFQVLGARQADIAASYRREEKTVAHATRTMAKRIGLTRRSVRTPQ